MIGQGLRGYVAYRWAKSPLLTPRIVDQSAGEELPVVTILTAQDDHTMLIDRTTAIVFYHYLAYAIAFSIHGVYSAHPLSGAATP